VDKEFYRKKYEDSKEASSYSKIFSSPSEKMISELEILTIRKIVSGLKNRGNYLDVACGFGRVAIPISEYFDRSFGVDTSNAMLSMFREKKIKLVNSDASSMPFEPGTFDCITCFRFIMNFERDQRMKILEEINRVLNKDGTFICNLHINRYSARGLMTVLRNRITSQKQPNMSYRQLRSELAKSGFIVKKTYGIKIIPYYGEKIFADYKKLFRIETILSGSKAKFFADGYIFVCGKR
jgi:ubiquinone/menaquinone biosynthesis C-methylase UbiE